MKKLVLAMTMSSLALVGCENMSNTQKGASIGAVTGALLGKGTGDHDKSRYVWGAAVGALAGRTFLKALIRYWTMLPGFCKSMRKPPC